MTPTLDEVTAALTAATAALTALAKQNPEDAAAFAAQSDVRFLPIIDSINKLQYQIENDANIQSDAKKSIKKELTSIKNYIYGYLFNLTYRTTQQDVVNAILESNFVTQSLLRQENRNLPFLPSTFSVNTFLTALLTGLIS